MSRERKIAEPDYYNLRTGSGKSFEYAVVSDLLKCDYMAKRLGGTTVNMPDVAATKTKEDIYLTFELKKTKFKNIIYIPSEQILRCFQFLKMFDKYTNKFIILGFNFLVRSNTRVLSNEKYFFCGNKLIPYILFNLKETGDKRKPYLFYYHMFSCNIYEETFLHYNNDYKPKERINLPYCIFHREGRGSGIESLELCKDTDWNQELDYLNNAKKYMENLDLLK